MTHTVEGILRPSALIVDNGNVLLVRHELEDWWVLPGGKANPREDAETAVRREVMEETKLVLGSLTLRERIYAISRSTRELLNMPLYVAQTYSGIPEASGEIADATWMNERNYLQIEAASAVSARIIPGMVAGNWQSYIPKAQLVA